MEKMILRMEPLFTGMLLQKQILLMRQRQQSIFWIRLKVRTSGIYDRPRSEWRNRKNAY